MRGEAVAARQWRNRPVAASRDDPLAIRRAELRACNPYPSGPSTLGSYEIGAEARAETAESGGDLLLHLLGSTSGSRARVRGGLFRRGECPFFSLLAGCRRHRR